MDLAIEDSAAWSEAIFGSVDLGDKRLTRRLAQIGKQLTSLPGGSLPESCEGQDALIEGSYRFLGNKRVTASQIAEGGYQVTSWLSQRIPTLLAIEDTTTLSYTHQIKESLGDLGGPKEKSNRGFHVH
ncbi:TPA: IS4/Tn5 family transposase DNA-binding protein, partial [Legionella pneumophila]